MWISWLLKYDGYPPGVVVALLVHGILLYIFLPKEFDPADQVNIEPASFVVASAVTQSPQRLRRIEQLNTQRRNEEREQQRRAEQRRAEEQRRADEQRRAEAEQRQQAEAAQRRREEEQRRETAAAEQRRREEAQRRETEENERRRAEAEQQRVAAERAAAEESARRAAEAQAQLSVENQMVAQYMGIIRDLVSAAWSRPPDAVNGMKAVVQLRLTPTGEIISSNIVSPSGSPTFDRSVLQAIDRVGSFSELRDMPTPIFERNFRAINLEFSPEDLLR